MSTTTTATASTCNILLTASLNEDSLGSKDLVDKIRSCRILLVGAGGIGCELLKNLALTGFTKIDVIDLDTIDVSNLNRQLLFRSHHVGMPKCTVACEVAAQMALCCDDPTAVKYVAHHGNVCDPQFFNVPFVNQFDVILNALDNVVARRRVNRIALASGVPLVEAGTTGYLGQVNVIDRASDIACYECVSQETQKVYPICTIRSTPSMPVHTIVWAKELYKLLFHDNVEESMLYETGKGDGDNAGADSNGDNDNEEGDGEPSTYMDAVLEYRKMLKEKDGSSVDTISKELIRVFNIVEIQKQLDMDRYKTAQKKPAVLDATILEEGCAGAGTNSYNNTNKSTTDVWDATECVSELVKCLKEACMTTEPILQSFDKDDDLAMRFVTAASNLRNHVFGIDKQSLYAAKGIAGNIIPAIATTNAICAGLQILQLFHILKNQLATGSKTGGLADVCKYMNCVRNPTRNGLYLTATQLEKPNPNCFVCGKSHTVRLNLNLLSGNWTLQEFLDRIVRKDLAFQEPSLLIEGDCIWEEGEDADTQNFVPNLTKKLKDLPCGGIQHGTMLLVEDFSQDLTVQVAIEHQEVFKKDDDDDDADDDDDPFKFVLLGGSKPAAAPSATENGNKTGEEAGKENGNKEDGDDDDDVVVEVVAKKKKDTTAVEEGDDDDDVIEIVDDNNDNKAAAAINKRPVVSENGDSHLPAKKRFKKTAAAPDTEIIEIE